MRHIVKNFMQLGKPRGNMEKNGLVTVCEEASCPNISECWQKRHVTFMILGDICTRACSFCNVRTGKPGFIDIDEPNKIAKSVS